MSQMYPMVDPITIILPGASDSLYEFIANSFDAELSCTLCPIIYGKVNSTKVTLGFPGPGSPAMARLVEWMHNLGLKTVFMLGRCASLCEEVSIGDIVLPIGAIRFEGTTKSYYPIQYPAIADFDMLRKIEDVAAKLKVKVWKGLCVTVDVPENVQNCVGNVVMDMELSSFFMVSMFHSLHYMALLIVSDKPLIGNAHVRDVNDKRVKKGFNNSVKILKGIIRDGF